MGVQARCKQSAPRESRSRRSTTCGQAALSAATRASILTSARIVLIREGAARFTVRRVAEAAQISSGNMMYHFPTKQHLMRELIRETLEKDEAELAQAMQDIDTPALRVEALIRALVKMGLDEETNVYYCELHAMAIRDATVAQLLAKYYEQGMANAVELLAKSAPYVARGRIVGVVQMIVAISEGAGLLTRLPFTPGTFDPEAVADLAGRLLGSQVAEGQQT
ncbi:MAG: helix-turn-helix domain containing protein [Beijerinckiaceae bacterium]|nr:helix-turn-helix domain containing protein [Beijerinckiaceae bacterium]